jgi:hypothetical protein
MFPEPLVTFFVSFQGGDSRKTDRSRFRPTHSGKGDRSILRFNLNRTNVTEIVYKGEIKS